MAERPRRAACRRLTWLLCAAIFAQLSGCTVFGGIAWRNVRIAFRTPDAVAHKIEQPARPEARLAALWVGHSTVLVQLDDKFILTDPVFTRTIGGVAARLVEPGIAAHHLPPIAATLVSHRHFDHLSTGSFELLGDKLSTVLVPPGVAADVPAGPYAVRELPLWQCWEADGLRITAVPTRHSGGRLIADAASHPHAYTGFVVEYHGLVVYYPGDTSWDEALFRALALRFPSIDLALMPIGPIAPEARMKPNHLNPEQALAASELLGARFMLPIHFATFVNSFDERGEVEAAFRKAVAAHPPVRTSTALFGIGEQRVLVPRESATTVGCDARGPASC